MISASDLSAWEFCPRQVYLKHILGVKPEKKEVMIKGTVKHKIFEKMIESHKKNRRFKVSTIIEDTLSKYVEDFEKFGTDLDSFKKDLNQCFDILGEKINKNRFPIPEFCEEWIESEDLGLKARVDVIFDDSGEWIVGDLKTNTSDFPGTRIQIGAGALLFEEHMNTKVNKIKIISHNDWSEKEIHLTDELRKQILKTRDDINNMLKSKEPPPTCSNFNKCAKCDNWESHCKPKNIPEELSEEKMKKSLWKKIFS